MIVFEKNPHPELEYRLRSWNTDKIYCLELKGININAFGRCYRLAYAPDYIPLFSEIDRDSKVYRFMGFIFKSSRQLKQGGVQ